MTEQQITIEHRADESQFVLIDTSKQDENGSPAVVGEVSYVDVTSAEAGQGAHSEQAEPAERVLYHTGVREAYGGQGLAARLVETVVRETVDAGLKIVPICSYVVGWLEKHPEFAGHVVKPQPKHLRAIETRTQ